MNSRQALSRTSESIRLLVAARLKPRYLGSYTPALSTSSSTTASVVSSCGWLRA